MKFFCAAIMCLKFWFVILWQKEIDTKVAAKFFGEIEEVVEEEAAEKSFL